MRFGIFYDTMIHDFDRMRWRPADEPSRSMPRTACMLNETENPHRDPDTAMVVLRMSKGALVPVNSSFRAVYGYDQRIEAFGEKAMLVSSSQHPTSVERFRQRRYPARSAAAFFRRPLGAVVAARDRRVSARSRVACHATDRFRRRTPRARDRLGPGCARARSGTSVSLQP